MEVNINTTQAVKPRLTIRISRHALSFSIIDREAENHLRYEPYNVKSGISMAANLREAFHTADLLSEDHKRVQVLLDTPVVVIPIEEWHEADAETLYHHAIQGMEGHVILSHVMPGLNAVAVFSINKDLKLVLDDHFTDVRFLPISYPVWSHLHQRSYTGSYRKLYGYFHDKKLDIFSFSKNRFRFCNTFDTTKEKDAVYFLLFVWKQLGMDAKCDEMHLVGTLPERETLITMLHEYIAKPYVINPTAEYNRAPITQVAGLPYDLITLFLKK